MEGKKSTSFDVLCTALGVEFDLKRSGERVLTIKNTEQRVQDITAMISSTLDDGTLSKQSALVLRGKLGFADSCLHGRLGALLLKQLSEHAFGRTSKLSKELRLSLEMMSQRLQLGKPRTIGPTAFVQWFVYTDAAYEPETKSGGLGAVLVNHAGECVSWFGFNLDEKTCVEFGANIKDTIIYELELCGAVLALDFWSKRMQNGLQVCFGDNDAARFSLIRGSCNSCVSAKLMEYHLCREADNNLCVWFGRVPTEANISDYPSRGAEHALLVGCCDESVAAIRWFNTMRQKLQLASAEQMGETSRSGPR